MSRVPYTTRDMIEDDLRGVELDIEAGKHEVTSPPILIVRALVVLARAVADVADVMRDYS